MADLNLDYQPEDEENAALAALINSNAPQSGPLSTGTASNPDEDLAKTAATTATPETPYMQNNSQALLASLTQQTPKSQPDFTDVYNGFKTGGLSGGMAKVIDYLNSPEGKEIVGGLISKQTPYAGAYMVDKAEQQKQIMAQSQMMSMGDKMKLATELVTKGDDRSIEMAKMLIGQDQFNRTFGQKNQEIANTAAVDSSTIQKNTADIQNQQAQQKNAKAQRQQEALKAAISQQGVLKKNLVPGNIQPQTRYDTKGEQFLSYDGGKTWN